MNRTVVYWIAGMLALVAIAGFFTGCLKSAPLPNSRLPNATAVESMSAQDLKDMLERGEDFILLDVHVPEQKHIPGTDLFIPYNELAANADRLPSDRNTVIAVYCRSGSMSAIAADELARMGYEKILDLRGGMQAWKEAGFQVPE